MTDSQQDNSPKKPRKPRGTKRTPGKATPVKSTTKKPASERKQYLSYEEAREYIRSEMIASRANYETWFQTNKPKAIPRFPYRYYEKRGWVSWNDFLGVENEFIFKKVARWRPFEEAITWAHQLKLETYEDWIKFARTDALPEDIPARPDVVYNKRWVSWNYWLGNKPSDRVKVSQENQGIFYIIRTHGHPGNVLTYGVEPMGLSALKNRWNRAPYDIIKIFKYSKDKAETVSNIVNTLTTEYHGHTKTRITPNVWEVVWYLSMHLEIITNYQTAVVHQRNAPDEPQMIDGLVPIDED
jgi:hypothetical protein